MITNIYFVRHAEPDYSIHDDKTKPLTQKGKIAAQKLVNFFEDKDIEVVLSSPYKRAVDTIKPYADKSSLQIEEVFELRERTVDSCWIEDFKGFSKKKWSDFNYKPSDGESLYEVQNRNITALKRTIKAYEGKNIIIGNHGTSLSTIINYYDLNFGYDDFEKIRNVMPWIVKFIFDDNHLKSIETIDSLR